jgi:predicted ATPase/DNA-binding winged helix-turn-helix (wHTH) protein
MARDLGSSAPTEPNGRIIAFGPFRLIPAEQLLLDGNRPVRLGSRALDILLALVEQPGELVSKEALIARVWPETIVEEVNLRVHVSALRRALGDGQGGRRFLATIPGRGYQFVSPVSSGEDPAAPSETSPIPAGPGAERDPARAERDPVRAQSLPLPLARMIGRAEFTAAILAQLPQRRFVTIVGPGGIGKTTVAVAVADSLLSTYADGICFVDLASVGDPSVVSATVALALGMSNFSNDPGPGIVASLRHKHLLLVLDSCERVVESAAILVEQVLKGAAGVHVLATSREPLRAEGERVLRLPPLGMAPISPGLTAAQAMEYPSVQLFVERASAILDGFTLEDADAPIVAEICARLDGIALAIELAVGHVAAFDLRSLAALLDDRFRLLNRGRRTALPRHQTMRAVLDWSYETVPEPERRVLRRLAVFEGGIQLAAARAVAADDELTGDAVVVSLANLVDRSLVTAEISDLGAHYRLLDTTRAYAQEKLAESGEQSATARRHAEYYVAALAQAEAVWGRQTASAWLAERGREIGNIRAALDWAFSPAGDAALGVALSASAVPLLFELSLAEECRRRAEQALAAMASIGSGDCRLEMRLRTSLGAAMMYTPGPVPQTVATWEMVLQAATQVGDGQFQARAVWALWTASMYGGEARKALALAEQFRAFGGGDVDATKHLLGERSIGVSLHLVGQQTAARDALERMLARYVPTVHRWQTVGSQIDHALMARATLARILWLQGTADQALQMVSAAVVAARTQAHAISSCFVLFEAAIPIALLVGDFPAAHRALDDLQSLAAQHGLAIWQAGGRCVRMALQMAQGDQVPVQTLEAALRNLRATGFMAHFAWLSGVMAEALGARGEFGAGLALLDEALARSAPTGEQWGLAELLRIQARLTARERPALAARLSALQAAQAVAERQGALAWTLRTAISLAELHASQHRRADAQVALGPVLARFTEGFGTADLVAARRLMADLQR